jgi:hypothetical protein
MRSEHEFQFPADEISAAAKREATYHEDRQSYWEDEYELSKKRVEETANLVIKEVNVTGGKRMDVVVDYGDAAAYKRVNEAVAKIDSHRKAAERFRAEAHVYGTQDKRMYELSADDVHYFRLGGGEQED